MDAAYLSAISALAGSVIGGLTAGLSTWVSERTHARAERLAHDLGRRQDLVRDFVVAASKAYGDAYTVHGDPKIGELVDLYAMISRMRVLAMPQSVVCAETLMRKIIDTYAEPTRTLIDLHDIMKSGSDGVDPLREFSEAAREELRALAPY